MKQSEYKKITEDERKQRILAIDECERRPITHFQIKCDNKVFGIGGYDNFGRLQRCWYCPNCGRSGCDYIEYSLKDGDKIIWGECQLKEG